ncbi:MAG: DUF222 domain-containing protein [Nocardioides sp.]
MTQTAIAVTAADVAALGLPASGAEAIDEIRSIEALKCALEARQARLALVVEADQRDRAEAAGVPTARRSRGVAAQIALARRVSPSRGAILLGLAHRLSNQLPHTWEAFLTGHISEWRATLIARDTACLSSEHAAVVDHRIAADPIALEARGDREITGTILAISAQLDAAAMVKRRRRAETDRRAWVRPAPDSMVYLTALLPMKTGIAAYAALKRAAETAVSTGRSASSGQAMADELVRRVTGCDGLVPPVRLNLVMSADTVFSDTVFSDTVFSDTAGTCILDGQPIPADVARELLADNLTSGEKTRVRRLFAKPESGALIAMESTSRLFPTGLADLIRLRDRYCRTPWCDAPIRHIDHPEEFQAGGPTTLTNGQGLCEACNHAKQAPGWSAATSTTNDTGRHSVTTHTPTGHSYHSTAPPMSPALVLAT